MINLNELKKISHQISTEKGWWDNGGPGTIAIILLIQSEVSEVLEDYRKNKKFGEIFYDGAKPCGIPTELADIIIRVCDFADSSFFEEFDLQAEYDETIKNGLGDLNDPKDLLRTLSNINLTLSAMYSIFDDKDDEIKEEYQIQLSTIIALVTEFCKYNNIDIEEAVRIKTEYNRTRSIRHGGKKI